MNFKTALSSTGGLIFIYQSGTTKKTAFTEVSYYGDDYLLARTENSAFYTLLDLDGNNVEDDVKVIYRFQNGLLLTYTNSKRNIHSADNINYTLNYNIYSIYNFDINSFSPINVFHQDESSAAILPSKVQGGIKPVMINDVLGKPLLQFQDFLFSEVIGERYILCCNLSLLNEVNSADISIVKKKKIWEVADVYNFDNNVADETKNIITGKTFKDTEIKLFDLIAKDKKSAGIVRNATIHSANLIDTDKWWKATLIKLLGSKS